MKLSDYLAEWLSQLTDQVFLVYGAANADLVDSIAQHDKLKYVCTMHEQAAGFAAEGVSKTSNQIGVALATSGPGGQNFVTSIANCYYDSIPAIFITGQVKTRFMVDAKSGEKPLRQLGFQETPIVDIVQPVTKWARTLKPGDENNIQQILDYMYREMMGGRPGPVLLDLPIDVQQLETTNPHVAVGYHTPNTYADSRKFINLWYERLVEAQRPAIIVGGGCHAADRETLLQFLDKLSIPVFPTWNALDIITDDLPYYGGRIGTFGGAGRNIALQNADLVLSLGCRMSGRITGGAPEKFLPAAEIDNRFMVDIDLANLDPGNMEVPFGQTLGRCIDDFLQDDLDRKYNYGSCHPSWLKKAIEIRDEYDPVTPEHFGDDHEVIEPYAAMRVLSEEMAADDILVADCGGNVVTINHSFKFKQGQRYITNNGNSPMGFAMCGAIGAAVANPDKRVVCVIGDGGMTMNSQELQTIKNYDLKNLKVIVFNNGVYGITKAFQQINFDGRFEACGPKGYVPPNFIRLAEAYGLKTYYIGYDKVVNISLWGSKDVYLKRNIQAFLQGDATLLDLNIKDKHVYFPRIVGWSTPMWDMTPRLEEDELREMMECDVEFSHRKDGAR